MTLIYTDLAQNQLLAQLGRLGGRRVGSRAPEAAS
jgi:hypothetical protein